jgi:hypothetical protein
MSIRATVWHRLRPELIRSYMTGTWDSPHIALMLNGNDDNNPELRKHLPGMKRSGFGMCKSCCLGGLGGDQK